MEAITAAAASVSLTKLVLRVAPLRRASERGGSVRPAQVSRVGAAEHGEVSAVWLVGM